MSFVLITSLLCMSIPYFWTVSHILKIIDTHSPKNAH